MSDKVPVRLLDDCKRLQKAFEALRINLSLSECQTLWCWYSEQSHAAGWRVIGDADESVRYLVQRVEDCPELRIICRILDIRRRG